MAKIKENKEIKTTKKTNNKKGENSKVENLEVLQDIKDVEKAELKELMIVKDTTVVNDKGDVDFKEIQKLKKQRCNTTNKESNNEGEESKKMTNSQIRNLYKTTHNFVDEIKGGAMDFFKCELVSDTDFDTIYRTTLTGEEIAQYFQDGQLCYDPTIQRGEKDTTKGRSAIFNIKHVNEISDSMVKGDFTPTQIHLVLIREEVFIEYNQDDDILSVNGKILLMDGQHRTRACYKLKLETDTGRLIVDNNLKNYKFPIDIHLTTRENARKIYRNIDRNLKLDKSQCRQLSNDFYSNIVNKLNNTENSPLFNKIATKRPVNDKLVLFTTLTDAIEKTIVIESKIKEKEVYDHLTKFFDMIVYKLGKIFGNDKEKRKDFREFNLLNENITMGVLTKLALDLKEEEFEIVINKIKDNVNFFEKKNPKWLEASIVKYKTDKTKGFAINNNATGLKALENIIFDFLKVGDDRDK